MLYIYFDTAMKMKNHFAILFSIVFFLYISGCGTNLPSDLPKLYPVSLVITQDGSVLEGATVQLLPQDSASRWSAMGKTDSTGKVDFYTEGRYLGVPEGNYKVVVFKVFTEPSKYVGKERPADIDYGTWDKMIANERRVSYHQVNPLYDSRQTTPLELMVGPKQEKDRSIDVGQAINERIK